jgi:hypothetical protein
METAYGRMVSYCIRECKRQGDLSQEGGMRMARGWQFLSDLPDVHLDMNIIRALGILVTGTDFRHTPVTFTNGNLGVNPQNIERCLSHVITAYPEPYITTDDCCREILRIHPWSDGNGRTVSLLRNYLISSLDFPQPLPEYDWN